jgi:hypothetical protein
VQYLGMTEIKLYKSKKKALIIFLLAVPLIAAGISIINKDGATETDLIMGWIGTCFFSLAIPVGLFHLFDKRPQMIINENGIFDRTLMHNDFIKWETIEDAYPKNIHGQHYICLCIPEEFKPSKKKSRFHKIISNLNESMLFQEMNINMSQLDANTLVMNEFIIVMAKAEKSERIELLKNIAQHRI